MSRVCILGISALAACAGVEEVGEVPAIPAPPREFRAAWVATVANIDWPSEPGLPVERQKEEALAILDRLVELHMNAVVFQVRPQADALYDSQLEPWSYYLTGEQGRAPEPYYDPLSFWVQEAHRRGLELHAWFNPYRANHPANEGGLSEESIVRARPELVVRLGDQGYWWMDPALSAVQDHSVAVVMDVVRRYDIDGVHFDDYFYPYREYNDGADFPDERSWGVYVVSGGRMSRGDWRRDAVNRFIERLYREIKAVKPHVKLGISPFGIWRPGYPESIRGLDQYDVLYADARLWWNEGWVDYLTPQLYWPIAQIPQSFPVLLGWWKRENVLGRHLWPGTSLGRMGGESGPTELVSQILITRGMVAEGPGICMFSMRSLMGDDGRLTGPLVEGPYAERALVPASPWLGDDPPDAPEVTVGEGEVDWIPRGDDEAFLWVVYVKRGTWSCEIVPGGQRRMVVGRGVEAVAVSAVDRNGNESPVRPVALVR